MKRLITLLIFIVSTTTLIFAQSIPKAQIRGCIIDAHSKKPLASATASCLLIKDSSRVTLSFSNTDGWFIFDSLPVNEYCLYITSLGYESLLIPLKWSVVNNAINLGIIKIKKTAVTLSEVEIKELKPPMRITRDTIEFSTSSLKVKTNALVEDLFKAIPGIHIDNDGTIKINGEVIKTIMINGRPIFSDIPQIITRNVQADLISKIQIIDRKSGNKEANGPLDTQPDKIINITIRKNKENLLSGEITMALATSNRFAERANISRFKDNQQLLVLVNGDNINGAMDSKSIGNNGVQRNWNIGGSYDEKVTRKTTLNINYYMSDNKTMYQQTSSRQNILGDTISFYTRKSNNISNTTSNAISGRLEMNIDSSQKIYLSNQLSFSTSNNLSTSQYESLASSLQKINNGGLENMDHNNPISHSERIRYEKNFKKEGRQLDVSLSYGNTRKIGSSYNISRNSYFYPNNEQTSDTINQLIRPSGALTQLFFMINYTEPVLRKGLITFTLGEDHVKSSINRTVFDYNDVSKLYNDKNINLSNNYENNPTQHIVRISWFSQNDKYDYTVSWTMLLYEMSTRNVTTGQSLLKKVNKLIPNFRLAFFPSMGKSIRLSYRRAVDFPDASQLQPVSDNSDPLYIKLGNPILNPTNSNEFNLLYQSLNATSLRNFTATLNAKFNSNEIINSILVDSIGRQTIQPQNSRGGYFINCNIENSIPFPDHENSFYLTTKMALNKTPSLVNSTKIFTNNLSLSEAITFASKKDKKYSLSISGNIDYNALYYSIQTYRISKYISGTISLDGYIYLPFGIIAGTTSYYGWVTNRTEGYNWNPLILNASISKTLFHQKQGNIQLQAFDLLKQNKNIIRNVGTTYIEDIRNNSLEQLFLLKLSYYLGKKK